jgi:DNA repair exonuclease SbcCD ATPase subunit
MRDGVAVDERKLEQDEIRAEALRLEQQRAKIRHLESRFERVWGGMGAVAEAFGAAWAASNDQAAAVKWYERAVTAEDSTASIRTTEQLANLRVREAWTSVDRARSKGKERQRIVTEARKTIEETIKVLEDLVRLQPSVERESLLGSAYKRLAMIEAAAGRDDEPAIGKMREHYNRAEKLGRDGGFQNVLYPALNGITAEVALNATRDAPAELDREALDRVRKILAAKALEDPDFWTVSGPTELEMWQALAQRALAPEWPVIDEAFDDLYARVSSPSSWASVYDNARFVLTRYEKHAAKDDEKSAARSVLQKLQAFASGTAS